MEQQMYRGCLTGQLVRKDTGTRFGQISELVGRWKHTQRDDGDPPIGPKPGTLARNSPKLSQRLIKVQTQLDINDSRG